MASGLPPSRPIPGITAPKKKKKRETNFALQAPNAMAKRKAKAQQRKRLKLATGARRPGSPGQEGGTRNAAPGGVPSGSTSIVGKGAGRHTTPLGEQPNWTAPRGRGKGKKRVTAGSKPKVKNTKNASSQVSRPTAGGGTTRSSAVTTAVGGGGGGGSVSVGAASRAQAKTAAKNKKGGKAATSKTKEEKKEKDGPDDLDIMFGSARRELDRQQQLADAQRLARIADQKMFDDWVAGQRGSADQNLAAAFAKSAADASLARQQSLDSVNKYAMNAMQQAGTSGLAEAGSQEMLKAAGTDANLESYGFRTAADAQGSAGAAFTQAALSTRQNEQREADRARAANAVTGYNAGFREQQAGYDTARSKLRTDEIAARMDQKDKERQYLLDQQAANFLNSLKQGELEVKQADAETRRFTAKMTAQNQQIANKLKAQYQDGQLTAKQVDQQLKRKGLSLKQKELALKYATGGGGGAGNKLASEAADFFTKWNNDNLEAQGLPAAPRDDVGIQYAYRAISALRGKYPGLKAERALSILGSALPGDVIQDQRIWNKIKQSFK